MKLAEKQAAAKRKQEIDAKERDEWHAHVTRTAVDSAKELPGSLQGNDEDSVVRKSQAAAEKAKQVAVKPDST